MKALIIGILIAIVILDVLLILGCAKLEKIQEEECKSERSR